MKVTTVPILSMVGIISILYLKKIFGNDTKRCAFFPITTQNIFGGLLLNYLLIKSNDNEMENENGSEVTPRTKTPRA